MLCRTAGKWRLVSLAKKLIVVACLGISGSSMSAFAQSNQHALPYVQTQNILEQTRHPAATLIVKVTNGPEPLDRAFLKCVVFDDKNLPIGVGNGELIKLGPNETEYFKVTVSHPAGARVARAQCKDQR